MSLSKISEKFVQAGIYLSLDKKEESKNIFANSYSKSKYDFFLLGNPNLIAASWTSFLKSFKYDVGIRWPPVVVKNLSLYSESIISISPLWAIELINLVAVKSWIWGNKNNMNFNP